MNTEEYYKIKERIGEKHLLQRLERQVRISTIRFGEGTLQFFWENLEFIPLILKATLKLTGLSKWAERQTLEYVINNNDFLHSSIPPQFHNYRILHLSDLHLDAIIDGGERLNNLLEDLPHYDLCVLTGDFRFWMDGVYSTVSERLQQLVSAIDCPDGILAILGNHDSIEMVPAMEAMGIRVLLNESISLSKAGAMIRIAGVDDPHYYEVDDLDKALSFHNQADFTLLLAHTPEIIEQAKQAEVGAYLCGHTHGGQICLPGGIPIINAARSPRRYIAGAWRRGDMLGYTSKGAGFSGFPIRLFCPPEVTIHRLIYDKV
jgi:uncharacterized protein